MRDNVPVDTGHGMEHARALFNAQDFFAAHEALEDLWRAAAGAEKSVLQALTQVAVALHHHSTGNLTGASSVLARARQTLQAAGGQCRGADLERLRAELAPWQRYLAGAGPQPPFPRL